MVPTWSFAGKHELVYHMYRTDQKTQDSVTELVNATSLQTLFTWANVCTCKSYTVQGSKGLVAVWTWTEVEQTPACLLDIVSTYPEWIKSWSLWPVSGSSVPEPPWSPHHSVGAQPSVWSGNIFLTVCRHSFPSKRHSCSWLSCLKSAFGLKRETVSMIKWIFKQSDGGRMAQAPIYLTLGYLCQQRQKSRCWDY